MTQTDPRLAALRRKHGSMWRIIYVVEGFDDPFEELVGGKHSKPFATTLSKIILSRRLGVKRKHIHLVSAEREG